MLIVNRNKKDPLAKVMKELKGKVTLTKLLKRYRELQAYKKPKERRREVASKGAYKQRIITLKD